MLDPVDETFFEFVEACLNHVQTPVLQRKFAALGGIDLLVRLCAMSMNDDVIVKACRAIAMLLRVEGSIPDTVPHSPSTIATASSKPLAVVNALKIRAAGGVAALLAQMRRSRNELVLQECSSAMKHLIKVYEASKELPDWSDARLFREGDDAFSVLVSLFRRWEELVGTRVGEGDREREKSRKADEVEGSRSIFVHAEMAEAIHYIALNDECKPALGSAGAICVLTQQVQESSEAAVQIWSCNALCVLVMSEENRRRFTQEEGATAIVSILSQALASSSFGVMSSAAHVLSNYMAGEGKEIHDYQVRVGQAGGCEVLLRCCERAAVVGKIEEEALEQCCGALCSLSFENDGHRVKLGDLGACETFARICQICDVSVVSHHRILEQACAGIGNFCKRNRMNRMRMGGCMGPETLVSVLTRTLVLGQEADAVALQALRAVSNVVMRNEENQERFADAGGCRQLVQYCFATRHDGILRWVLVALGALAQHELIRYKLVNEGAMAAVSGAERSCSTAETKEAAKRVVALLPPPAPVGLQVRGSIILKDEDEEVFVQCRDGCWVKGNKVVIKNAADCFTSLSSRFVQSLHFEINDLNHSEGDGTDRRRSPAGLHRIRLKVRDREISIDAALDGKHAEDIVIGPALLAKLKIFGFEHMVNELVVL
ncbi:hypothetical protein GUITHDRAFT_135246 [Guillardia theta CCMP2712]|uniref:Uncharacterized protein n=1 Tax=Guillardia theta (strain CCMP2712) TaxID=905079 RepID=L1JQ80_GUITC|nr:hypothetical protein GUITHDRAFT_135246 [Guillardia theta CCMP2712]EKX50622.1 hypothetical protein GUITHDRAFT_135246 [Guillardia theta CCMP2712]|eukprot:XP_005837602.1 hypothetical protein GUITHDRAFT_135246 [Guillardia theta CCMP2712]